MSGDFKCPICENWNCRIPLIGHSIEQITTYKLKNNYYVPYNIESNQKLFKNEVKDII